MSEFVCKKPITLSGCDFSYGQIIPDGYVLPQRTLALIRSGYITEIENGLPMEVAEAILPVLPQTGETEIKVPITTDDGIIDLIISPETAVKVFSIMQLNVESATKEIETLEDENVLILLNAVDSRKGIKSATEAKANQLNEKKPEEEENSAGE